MCLSVPVPKSYILSLNLKSRKIVGSGGGVYYEIYDNQRIQILA